MRILKSKSRFPNRTHPKNKHAFFLRSFVLVVCLFVFCFLSIATIHSPPQRFSQELLDFRYAKWVQARKQNIFVPALTRAMPLTLSPCLFEPLWRREAAGSTWAVCLHNCFWEELILILIYPLPYLFQLQSAGRWSWLDLICGRAVEHMACCTHHQPKRRTLYHAATRTAGENEKINSHQVIKISVLTSHGDFR